MMYKHEMFEEVGVLIIKPLTLGYSQLGHFNTKHIQKCKYCNYEIILEEKNMNPPSCISDEEKIIKKLLE